MTSLVPGFNHDVFVSYAHVDNRTFGGSGSGWVEKLVDDLKEALAQQLGRQERGEIWLDRRRLSGDIPLSDGIHEGIKKTAILMVVLSSGYLESPWCAQERQLFLESVQSDGGKGRLFLIRMNDLASDNWPDEFKDKELLGFDFFQQEKPDAPVYTLGTPPAEDPGGRRYWQRVDHLAQRIAIRLRQLRDSSRALPENTETTKPAAAEHPKTAVYVAEVTPDLDSFREQMCSELEQKKIQVLPLDFYERAIDRYKSSLQQDLAGSRLFVQLLGAFASRKTKDFPDGYEGLQLEQALAAKMDIMRWHAPELNLENCQDPELISRREVMVMNFEEFRQAVVAKALAPAKAKADSNPEPLGDTNVLINASSVDEEIAIEIADNLDQQAIGYYIAAEDEELVDLTEQEDFHGMLVVYGQCERDWANRQVKLCRQIWLGKKDQPPVCGVYTGPAESKPRLLTRPSKFIFFEHQNTPAFERFVTALRGGEQ